MTAPATLPAAPATDGSALRPFRSGLWFGFFNAINWQVALGTPMVLLCEALGASPLAVGLAYAFVFILTPVQVLSTALLPRLGFRRLMIAGWGLRSLFLLPAIFVAAWARADGPAPWMVPVLIGSVFCFTLLRSVASCAWVPWLYAILPAAVRGKYFATDQLVAGIGSIGILVTCAVLFRALPLFEAFIVQYSLSFLGAVLSWFFLRRMPDGPRPQTIGVGRVVRTTPGLLIRPSAFRRFLGSCVVFAVLTSPIPPFCAYYLRVQGALEPGNILLFATMQYAGVVLGSMMLRDQIDRAGPRPFFFLGLLLHAAVAAYWLVFVGLGWRDTAWLPLIYLVLGMGSATWIAANLTYLPSVTSGPDRPLLLSVHGAVTAFIGGLSPIAWGYLLRTQPDGAGINPTAFAALFAVALGGCAVLALWLRRFDFPVYGGERVELGSLVLRPQRAFTYLINLVDTSFKPAGGTGARDERTPPVR
jgi:hypothetical protein